MFTNSVKISSLDSSFSSDSARNTSRSLRRNCFSFVMSVVRTSCWVSVLPPCEASMVVAATMTARAMPCQSTPGCWKKRSSSAASTACTTTGGICSQVTGTRRCSPICASSLPSRLKTRSGTCRRTSRSTATSGSVGFR